MSAYLLYTGGSSGSIKNCAIEIQADAAKAYKIPLYVSLIIKELVDHKYWILITPVGRKGSDDPTLKHSLVRPFASREAGK